MMHPKVTFKLNKLLDKRMAYAFSNTSKAGVDFSKGVISKHPRLKKVFEMHSDAQKIIAIGRYFDLYYKHNGATLKRLADEFTQDWKKVEARFFGDVEKLFKGYQFPRGKYIGYVSAINCNPRFLHDKTFQVFYKHTLGVKFITSHELMHFIFYDYAIKRHYLLFAKKNPDDGIFWDTAEIFNSVVLSDAVFVRHNQVKKIIAYPHHRKYIGKLVRVWKETRDADVLIKAIYKEISRNQ